ncbi:hypothetical protein KCU61_g24, partial [Aureobasidium melanogenum]
MTLLSRSLPCRVWSSCKQDLRSEHSVYSLPTRSKDEVEPALRIAQEDCQSLVSCVSTRQECSAGSGLVGGGKNSWTELEVWWLLQLLGPIFIDNKHVIRRSSSSYSSSSLSPPSTDSRTEWYMAALSSSSSSILRRASEIPPSRGVSRASS